MKPKRALAASFVVSVAALPACRAPAPQGGCQPPECHANPPPQPPRPTASETTQATPPPTVATGAPTPSASASAQTATGDELPRLCTATNDQLPCIRKQSDGTCMLLPVARGCPPNTPCNPPVPRRIACP